MQCIYLVQICWFFTSDTNYTHDVLYQVYSRRNLSILFIKYQSYQKCCKIQSFEQKLCICHNVVISVLASFWIKEIKYLLVMFYPDVSMISETDLRDTKSAVVYT